MIVRYIEHGVVWDFDNLFHRVYMSAYKKALAKFKLTERQDKGVLYI